MAARRRGEDVLRSSGLGYTVVRPGPVVEEPGGYKALVFDQGNRISSAISCADLADVAVKATHPLLDGAHAHASSVKLHGSSIFHLDECLLASTGT